MTSRHGTAPRSLPGPLLRYGAAALAVAAVTVALLLVDPPADRVTVALCFMLGVVVLAASAGYGPGILTALLSFVALNFFFIPPRFSMHVAEPQSWFQLGAFLVIAAIAGTLAARARSEADAARSQSAETAALYQLSQQISAQADLDHVLLAIAATTCRLLGAPRCVVLLYDERGSLVERAAVGEAPATCAAHHVFIRDGASVLGGLRVTERAPSRGFSPAEARLLDAVATQAYLAVDRARLAEETARGQALAASDRLKSALLSSVSHDLRTPLATIKGASTALLAEDVTLDAAAERELLQTIEHEASRLNQIIGNWLDIARIAAGGLRFERDWQSAAELLGAAAARCSRDHPGARCLASAPDDLPLLWANAALIEQVLGNLLENAARFTPPGGQIRIAAAPCEDGAPAVAISVADDGPGFAPADLPLIFEAHYRGRHAPGERGGSGLGLAICKGIVEAHGGRIWAGRAPGGGASITFTVPTRAT